MTVHLYHVTYVRWNRENTLLGQKMEVYTPGTSGWDAAARVREWVSDRIEIFRCHKQDLKVVGLDFAKLGFVDPETGKRRAKKSERAIQID
jgi:hypothetical protein